MHHAGRQDCGLTFPLRSAAVPPICHSHLLLLLQTLHLPLPPPPPTSDHDIKTCEGRTPRPAAAPLLFAPSALLIVLFVVSAEVYWL